MILVSPDVLNAMKDRPTSSEAVSIDNLDKELKETLQRHDVSPYDKVQIYNQILQRYMTYYTKSVNRPISVKVTNPTPPPPPIDAVGAQDAQQVDEPAVQPKDTTSLLTNFPVSMVKKGQTILNLIQNSKGVLDWNQQGELVRDGEVIPGSHISDLVYDVLQYNKGVGFEPRGWEMFLQGLAKLNVPERLISNSNRRRTLQQIKKDAWTPPRQSSHESMPVTKSKKSRKKERAVPKRVGRLQWESYPQ